MSAKSEAKKLAKQIKETQGKKKNAEKQLKSAYANLRVCDKFNGNDDMSSSIKENIKRLDVILALKDNWDDYTYESTYLDQDNEEQIEGRHALQDIAEALRAIADFVDTDMRDLNELQKKFNIGLKKLDELEEAKKKLDRDKLFEDVGMGAGRSY